MTSANLIYLYIVFGLITVTIGSFRALTDKQSTDSGPLDSLSWFFAWFIYLPIFIVRFIKYKIKGKNL